MVVHKAFATRTLLTFDTFDDRLENGEFFHQFADNALTLAVGQRFHRFKRVGKEFFECPTEHIGTFLDDFA